MKRERVPAAVGRFAAVLVAAVALVAIPASGSAGVEATSASSPHIDAVAAYLNRTSPGTQGRLWWVSHDNLLPPVWLLQTPNCWLSDVCGVPSPGGRLLLQVIRRMVGEARTTVDITDLWPPPDRSFLDAVASGLADAYNGNHRVPLVRIIAGKFPLDFGSGKNEAYLLTSQYLDAFKWSAHSCKYEYVFGIRIPSCSSNFPLRVQIAYVQPKNYSWVHEKAIVIDGHDALIGGMNYWTEDYLAAHPVNDVSIEVVGPAAADVLSFDNILWRWACAHQTSSQLSLLGVTACTESVAADREWPMSFGLAVSRDATILTVGHLGAGIELRWAAGRRSAPINSTAPDGETYPSGNPCTVGQTDYSDVNNSPSYEYVNPGEDALRALIGTATRSIFISQQDLLSCAPRRWLSNPWQEPKFDSRVFQALATKILAKVPITIVVSAGTGRDYTNGFSLQDIARALQSMVNVQGGLHDPAKARAAVCADVSLAKLQQGPASEWSKGEPFRNHAKLVAVDNEAFYIGSENLYPSRLQELGMIVEDHAAAADLYEHYLYPMWWGVDPSRGGSRGGSRATALIDPAQGVCGNW